MINDKSNTQEGGDNSTNLQADSIKIQQGLSHGDLELIRTIINEAVSSFHADNDDISIEAGTFSDELINIYFKYLEYNTRYASLIGHSDPVDINSIFVEPEIRGENKKVTNLSLINKERVLIKAPPGAGKSTLAKYICRVAIGEKNKEMIITDRKIPFFIIVRDLPKIEILLERITDDLSDETIKYILNNKEKTSSTFLERIMVQQLETLKIKNSATLVEFLLKNGKVCLIVDGLDETTEKIREYIVDSLGFMVSAYKNNNYIAFSRPKAVSNGIYGFNTFSVVPFDKQRWEKCIDNWFSSDNDNSKELKSLIDNNEYFKDLCGNPLLVSILCTLIEKGFQLPQKKSDLYRSCIDALMEDFDHSKRLRRPSPFTEINIQKRMDILSEIAFKMHINSKQKARLRDIEEYLKEKSYLNKIICRDELQKLLDSLELEHGILVEWSKGEYSFPHRTFQEYLTAWNIERSRKEEWFVHALHSELQYNIEQWREVAIILAHLLYDPSEYIKNIVNFAFKYDFKKSLLEDILIQDISCTPEILEYAKNRLNING